MCYVQSTKEFCLCCSFVPVTKKNKPIQAPSSGLFFWLLPHAPSQPSRQFIFIFSSAYFSNEKKENHCPYFARLRVDQGCGFFNCLFAFGREEAPCVKTELALYLAKLDPCLVPLSPLAGGSRLSSIPRPSLESLSS